MSSIKSDKWSAANYHEHASFVYSAKFTSVVLDMLGAKSGERILDVGCGSGEITVDLEKIVGKNGLVVGVDFSANMIEKAKANGCSNVYVSDGCDLQLDKDLEHTFDAAFSNAALHWMKRDPAGVLRGVKRALKPGGRFVAEMGGYLNIVGKRPLLNRFSGLRTAIHEVCRKHGIAPEPLDPWYFPSEKEYTELLESEDFKVEHISLNPRITVLPGRLYNWLITFARTSILDKVSDELAAQIMQEVEDMCAVDMRDKYGNWSVMYVRLRFSAIAPS
ncbi:S-adenosyl-L-methionine-dependent methyltransferase [Dacryopinax primogenitus]|uniref:S-adenosyl-L-methionine-dependent methyltransferase n=1 Tax=Dacryopinax primogenitus (strain DJM 731) TaxID=1858805 RepID=M5G387_DACPD|nr:S-adenosyl-L-methionine-dependent methyltransferase [Dacryopinax primogenitus]EJU03159.1 S-adenosyl-L-methionine-dependent methyltransferase [Dacryopinax primogenitus]